jgi:uncharacterized protein (TIGR02421 family)
MSEKKVISKGKMSAPDQKKSARYNIGPEFIEDIKIRLMEGKRIRRRLPKDGWLNIDRQLPFLIVYRKPSRKKDEGTHRLVKGEAAYMVASGARSQHTSLSKLILTIVETETKLFGSFLIIEVWSTTITQINILDPNLNRPEFKIITSPTRPPTRTVEALEEALKRIRVNKLKAKVDIAYDKNRIPAGFPSLISMKDALKMNCFVVGLQVGSMFRNQETGELYPLALRRLHLGISSALKQAAFVFARKQTNLRPKHYQALGKRALVKSVWEIDRQLAEIDSMFNFLLLVTPVNVDQAWSQFRKCRFEKVPELYYRLRPVDPALLKRDLYKVPVELIEDPVIADLLRDKRNEINRKLTMLEDRNLPQFFQGSLQLYGGINQELLSLAQEMLRRIRPHSRNGVRKEYFNAETFARKAEEEFSYYREKYPAFASRVEIRDDIVGLMVVSGNLMVSRNTRISDSRVEALIQHEIGTHVLTYYNGKFQPFRQLYCGLPGYEELQEGLAVLAEYMVGGLSNPRLRLLAGRVIASGIMIDGASFIDTFRQLNQEYGFDKRTAYTITVRTFRGGGLTKDAVYLRGLVQLLDYLKNDGDLDPLFVGKIALDQVSVIRELQWRKVLNPAPLKPRYLMDAKISQKISILRKMKNILDLIN